MDITDPWAWFETRYDDGVVVRIAQTLADAEATRDLIRDAWAVDDDEPDCHLLHLVVEQACSALDEAC